jgi:anti-sigma regulatory factor (Ser/Thr protein kinase)
VETRSAMTDPVTWSLPLPRWVEMAAVRRWVRRCLGDGDRRLDDVVLVVVELVTNAYVHAGFPVELRVSAERDAIEVQVADPDPTAPRIRVSESRLGGNGLVIVDKIAAAWGTRPAVHGKTVWARLSLTG